MKLTVYVCVFDILHNRVIRKQITVRTEEASHGKWVSHGKCKSWEVGESREVGESWEVGESREVGESW